MYSAHLLTGLAHKCRLVYVLKFFNSVNVLYEAIGTCESKGHAVQVNKVALQKVSSSKLTDHLSVRYHESASWCLSLAPHESEAHRVR